MNKRTAKTWAVERRIGFKGYSVTHRPSCLKFWASSKAEAGRLIDTGWYEKQIRRDLQVKPAARREWYTDPITGTSHLYTGELLSWHCDVHEQTCSPFTPVTTNDILHMAARDDRVSDGTFVVLRQVLEDRFDTDECAAGVPVTEMEA
jgi:hypothetical protein